MSDDKQQNSEKSIENTIAAILKLRKRVKPDPTGMTIKEMIEEGRTK